MVLLLNLAVALVLIGGALGGWLTRGGPRGLVAVASLPLVAAGVLAAYAFGEDSYRGHGISRWDAYRSPGGALGLFGAGAMLTIDEQGRSAEQRCTGDWPSRGVVSACAS